MNNEGAPPNFIGRHKVAFLCISCILLGGALGAGVLEILEHARSRKSAPNKFVVLGEVFLQVKSGEAQHAPGATVYLFAGKYAETWLEFLPKAVEQLKRERKSKREMVEFLRHGADAIYLKDLPSDPRAKGTSLESRKFETRCDSTGSFALGVPESIYAVVAFGRAGLNEAIWFSSLSVPENQKISLAEPIASYFDSP